MTITDLIEMPLVWERQTKNTFMCDIGRMPVTLRVNDYPDESLFTLYFLGESLEIEESPSNWILHYDL